MRHLFMAAVLLFPLESVAPAQTPAEVVAEIRIHGNHTTPDAEVVKLTGVTIGEALTPETLAQVTQRLRASRRFDDVDVRKRYRSLTDASQVALIVLVHEYPSVDSGVPIPGPMRRVRRSAMFLPILNYAEGYGFTYGARASFVDALGKNGRVSVPLTWGGTKRAAVELEKGFERGPLSRIQGGASVSRRENPHYEQNDDRQQLWVRADREIVRGLRVGALAGWTDVGFGSRDVPGSRLDNRFITVGADAILDTRHDPIFPRDGVYARAAWESLNFRDGPTVNRFQTELRGYVGLIGQSVLSLRALHDRADRPLPPYEQPLLGGGTTLRGFGAGAFAGDNLFASSAELRVPLSSPMGVSRLGVTIFVDAAASYNDGVRLRDAKFHQGVGGGVFLLATIFQLNLDVAYGIDNRVRVHFTTGFQF
jgi:outer membrane protein assembly factor BamA